MGEETVLVDPSEDIENLIARLRQSPSKNVTLVLASDKTRALNTLENFQALRKMAREEGFSFTFSGGGKTAKGLAKVLGFKVDSVESKEELEPAQTGARTASFSTPNYLKSPALENPTVPSPIIPSFSSDPSPAPTTPGPGYSPGSSPSDPLSLLGLFEEIPDSNDPVFQTELYGQSPAQTIQPPVTPSFDFNEKVQVPGSIQELPTKPNKIPGYRYDQAEAPGPSENNPNTESGQFKFAGEVNDPLTNDHEAPPSKSSRSFNFQEDSSPEEISRPVVASGPSRRLPKIPFEVEEKLTPARVSAVTPEIQKLLNPGQNKAAGKTKVQPGRGKRRLIALPFILVACLALVLLVLAGFLLTSPPRESPNFPIVIPIIAEEDPARISITYKTTPISNTVSILLDPGVPNPGTTTNVLSNTPTNPIATGGKMPVTAVSPGVLTVKGEYPAFGSKMEPTGTASGTITIINSTTRAVSYEAGRLIYNTRGISYRLKDATTVGGGNVFSGVQGKASGIVVADKAGPVGNLPNGFAIYITDAIAIQSGPILGGTEQAVKVVSGQDIETLKKSLVDKAQTEAQASLKEKYNPATQTLLGVNNLETNCQFNRSPGDVANLISGSCSFTPQGYVYNKADLQIALQDQLVPDPKSRVDPKSLSVSGEGQLKSDNGKLILMIPVSAQTYSPVDLNRVREALAQKTISEAQQIISNEFPQIERLDLSGVKGTKLPKAPKLEIFTLPVENPAPTQTQTPGPTISVSPSHSPQVSKSPLARSPVKP